MFSNAHRGHGGLMFSKKGPAKHVQQNKPAITSRRATSLVQANAGEILDSRSGFRCRRWHPANFRGRSVSSALPCISFHNRAEGTAGTFQRGKFPDSHCIRKRISRKLNCEVCAHKKRQRTASQGYLAEPIYYSKRIGTSSTRVFASQKRGRKRGHFEPGTWVG
jgi:hypothetical protein